jgi:hypothetical protein
MCCAVSNVRIVSHEVYQREAEDVCVFSVIGATSDAGCNMPRSEESRRNLVHPTGDLEFVTVSVQILLLPIIGSKVTLWTHCLVQDDSCIASTREPFASSVRHACIVSGPSLSRSSSSARPPTPAFFVTICWLPKIVGREMNLSALCLS